MVGFDELPKHEFFLTPSHPVLIELNRLHNQIKEKDRELGVANSEIKSLRLAEVLKDKAVEELTDELKKFDEKLRVNESLVEQKNLEIKKLKNEKKEALAAQFAAESTLRRVYANQKDDDFFPVDTLLAPLEAEIKIYKNEISGLKEDNKALERLTKSKELALLESEKILKSALERALIVEEVQNQNFELKRQIEICQEENRVLHRGNRQKVSEVEKLSQTIQELEEAILAGGATANSIRDYRRQISELNEEKRILERELARAKVAADRVASVVANEWKDENDKVMPVKQWLEERRFLQAEMQRLRDKLSISERTAKAEAQLKDKLRARLKTLEEGLKRVSSVSSTSNPSCGSEETKKSNQVLSFLNKDGLVKRSTSQVKASVGTNKSAKANSLKTKNGVGGNTRISRSKVADSAEKENAEAKENSNLNRDKYTDMEAEVHGEKELEHCSCAEKQDNKDVGSEDVVSGFLYDRLQREVINLRKRCESKDGTLNAKDEEIKVLMRKVDALTKTMEIESKKLKREVAAREKELLSVNLDDTKQSVKNTNFSKR